ncbi:MAG: GNAT family N-acetyltransferase [Lactovum sp.]
MKIKTTRDTLSNCYFDALKIRNKVFVKEQHIAYSLEMSSALQEAKSIHFVLYDEKEKACATCRLLTEEDLKIVTLQRMAVLVEERGKKYASQLLSSVIQFSKEQNIQKILLHSQLKAINFYKKFNFQEEGEIFEEAEISHLSMTLNLN